MAERWYSPARLSKITGEPQIEGRWIDLSKLPPPAPSVAPMVVSDVGAYRSTVTGEMIGGRRQHREHLRQHDLIEVGNERMPPRALPEPDSKEIVADIKRAIEQGPSPGQAEAIAKAAAAI